MTAYRELMHDNGCRWTEKEMEGEKEKKRSNGRVRKKKHHWLWMNQFDIDWENCSRLNFLYVCSRFCFVSLKATHFNPRHLFLSTIQFSGWICVYFHLVFFFFFLSLWMMLAKLWRMVVLKEINLIQRDKQKRWGRDQWTQKRFIIHKLFTMKFTKDNECASLSLKKFQSELTVEKKLRLLFRPKNNENTWEKSFPMKILDYKGIKRNTFPLLSDDCDFYDCWFFFFFILWLWKPNL